MNWISVKNKKPKEGDKVLIIAEGKPIAGAIEQHDLFLSNEGYWHTSFAWWLPLPKPPKSKDFQEFLKRKGEL
jgi:hypothetical protein